MKSGCVADADRKWRARDEPGLQAHARATAARWPMARCRCRPRTAILWDAWAATNPVSISRARRPWRLRPSKARSPIRGSSSDGSHDAVDNQRPGLQVRRQRQFGTSSSPGATSSISSPMSWQRHAFEMLGEGFPAKLREYDILVAGRNFGCGSARGAGLDRHQGARDQSRGGRVICPYVLP